MISHPVGIFITTEDGYILTFFPDRINNTSPAQKPVVLLMHGFAACSAEYVNQGPEKSLGFILADAGYDVWLANVRGTTYSRNHTTLNVDTEPEKYFNFTWHEIGYYDLASSVDYILESTGEESLQFVGHSQGTTVLVVLLATRPEYNVKIRLSSLMAPAVIVEHYPNDVIQLLADNIDLIWRTLQSMTIYEIPFVEVLRKNVIEKCSNYPTSDDPGFCDLVYELIFGNEGDRLEPELLPVLLTNCPSSAGMKQYMHFGQLVRDGGFHQFDYGTEGNLEVYGTETPPEYDLSKISSPIALFYSVNDGEITVEDANTLASMLPNVVENYLVPDDLFNHFDFIIANDAVELVYNELLSLMGKY